MNWKTIAIIFMILFILETTYIVWSIIYVVKEEEKINICFYDICEDYPDAWYEKNICYCYDEDDNLAKTEWIRDS